MLSLYSFFKRRLPLSMVERRNAWGINHYGEVLQGKQIRLKTRIITRLETQDYRCRLPDAKHPVVRYKLQRQPHPFEICEWVWM